MSAVTCCITAHNILNRNKSAFLAFLIGFLFPNKFSLQNLFQFLDKYD